MSDKNEVFEWKQEYSVGIHSIDGQHQNLFAAARELEAGLNQRQCRAAIGRLLDRLVRYTATHFAHEERLMERYAYPDLAQHRLEHETLTRQVLEFQADYEAGHGPMAEQVLPFLQNWLEHHIQETDTAYTPYVNGGAAGL